jgi:Ca2+-binding EF-hand superfamily protein
MKRVDFDENGEINYSEFVSGTLDRSLLSEENLLKVFKYLDSTGNKVLTYDSLMRSFERRGDFN